MSAGDTCTVYAGTYNENVTVPAGTAGNYKTINVNGSDVVTVLGFTLNSHTKLIGNCTAPAAINTCGFNIQNTSAPSSAACVAMPNSTTDVYIRNNVMYACGSAGMIQAGYPESVTYIYVQGNTLSYACITQAQAGSATKECDGIYLEGNHVLVENNDLSHYTLGIFVSTSYGIFRNNVTHDQYQTEAGGNSHTDAWFSEPGVSTFPAEYNVIEGNYQYNGFGTDAKGSLSQTDGCGGACYNLIERFNHANRVGGAIVTNNTGPSPAGWPYTKAYNNTWYDTLTDQDFSGSCSNPPIGDNSMYAANAALLNNIYYFTNSGMGSGSCFNPYACGSNGQNCNYGYDMLYCTAGCSGFNGVSGAFGHIYQSGSFTDDTGNKIANPNFVNPGSDFHLQAGSPAIAAGTYLTTVASVDAGSGTSLVVKDAAYFQDGYGLSNAYSTVNGDCIAVGTASNHVCVTAVNYSTNTLTLASSISRSAGQGVYLYSKSDGMQVLTGSAPDMGAYPYGSSGPPAPPSSLAAVVH
jgi:hypothetical protein